MYVRRGAAGDAQRAARLLDVALQQFGAIGMTGWIRRAEALRAECGSQAGAEERETGCEGPGNRPTPGGVFRKEGDYWTVGFEGRTIRLKDAKGLRYLGQLLRHPGRECHALDLVTQGAGSSESRRGSSDDEPLLDAQAKAAYKRRLDELRDGLAERRAQLRHRPRRTGPRGDRADH